MSAAGVGVVADSLMMETFHESIYDHPKYYDLVFGADCAAEVRFILGCAGAYLERPLRRVFEPACGTGRLLFALARRGLEVSGLDLNQRAIAYCNARLDRHRLPPSGFVADMADFRVRRRSDVAINTINSFRHLPTEAAARAHLECMAGAVGRGGLYLLGIHLTPTAAAPSETESWSARRGNLAVNTHMWTIERDRRRRRERFGIRFDVRTPRRSFRINDVLELRSYTAGQMRRLLRSVAAWELAETFDFAYDLGAPIQVDATSEDVVYVLCRR